MSERRLLDALVEYTKGNMLPMHMPGHKRARDLPWQLPYAIDITEIEGFDDLHNARSILRDGMRLAAETWGAKRSFFLVGGSTVGILAAVRAAARPGGAVLMASNCHKSVYHAVELCGLRPVYIQPEWDSNYGVYGSVSPRELKQALWQTPDACLVVLTSPTYEGVLSDVEYLAALCHSEGIPMLVDEAHGAHLGFSKRFSGGAVAGGADIVVQSIHKTLTGLTQTGLCHVQGDLVDPNKVARELNVFETSSPSYPLMASIDECVHMLKEEGTALFLAWEQRMARFDQDIAVLNSLRVLCHGEDTVTAHVGFFGYDPGKIVISTRGCRLTGPQLAQELRQVYDIEPEMCTEDSVLCMTGICDSMEGVQRLAGALLAIDARLTLDGGRRKMLPKRAPEPLGDSIVLTPAEALSLPARLCGQRNLRGKVAAEYIWAYPPGVPLVVPGQRLTEDVIAEIARQREAGLNLISTSGQLPGIMCCDV